MKAKTFGVLREQLERLARIAFYRDKFEQSGMSPADLKGPDDFSRIPFTTSSEYFGELRKPPSESSLFTPEVTRINFSPSGKELYPVYQTANDLQRMHRVCASSLKAAGVQPDDVCVITFGYHLFIAGLFYQGQLEYYGAKAIPLGPGDSEAACKIINDYQATVLISNPTFAMKLAQGGIPSVRILFVGGEPFTSVEGYPERTKAAFGRELTIIDSYSMAACMPIARSCRHENGLHMMDDFVHAEVIDPESGESLPLGEKGELVLTHLHKEAAPLLRYRTGDLTVMEQGQCACGRDLTLPQSIIGRTDEMLKIKGVKFWPSQIATILRSFPEFSGPYRLKLRQVSGVDFLQLTVEGKPGAKARAEELADKVKRDTLVRVNEITVSEKLEEGPLVVDEREGRSF
jgi:phenylacetate-coenzyme A ligase PaaK-like adenylate-forming protein